MVCEYIYMLIAVYTAEIHVAAKKISSAALLFDDCLSSVIVTDAKILNHS